MNTQSNTDNKRGLRFIRIHGVMFHTGLSRSYIYHLSGIGLFPKSISLVPGGKARGWLEQEVLDWVTERVAERDQKEPIS